MNAEIESLKQMAKQLALDVEEFEEDFTLEDVEDHLVTLKSLLKTAMRKKVASNVEKLNNEIKICEEIKENLEKAEKLEKSKNDN